MIKSAFGRAKLPPPPGNKIQIFSDGNDDYKHILPKYYADTCIDPGQLIKIREKWRIVDKIKRTTCGNPELTDIKTTNAENLNGILRERVRRLIRKSKCHSKKRTKLNNTIKLFQFHWTFMHKLYSQTLVFDYFYVFLHP